MLDVLAIRTVRSIRVRPVCDVGHLVATLATADVDDDVRSAPLGQLVLKDGLARAEVPGHGSRPAARNREEGVNGALACHEHFAAALAPPERPRPAHRPVLTHSQFQRARGPVQHTQDIPYAILAFGLDRTDPPRLARRHKQPVLDGFGLPNHAEDLAFLKVLSVLHPGHKLPLPGSVQRLRRYAGGQESADLPGQHGKWALHTVEDVAQQARGE
jgi:hypothetical protein